MAKQRPAPVKNRPRFKDAYLRVLGNEWLFDKGGKTYVTVGGLLFFYVGSGLELKHMEKGKIVVPMGELARLNDVLAAMVNDPDGKIGKLEVPA
jgi:hypothetical protein